MVTDIMNTMFVQAMRESDLNRIVEAQEFQYVWNADYEMIIRIVKKYFKDKPFSEDTLAKYMYLYRNDIRKIVNRKCAGIYDQEPLRELIIGQTTEAETVDNETGETIPGKTIDDTDPNLINVLSQCKYHRKVKDAYKQSKFFNTIIVHPVFRDNKLELDILTGAMCAVTTKEDYLKIKEIKIARVDADGKLYNVYWSEEEHYAEYEGGERKEIENNPDGVNPYIQDAKRYGISSLPFVVLRDVEGLSFWGEPNWALFFHQLESIMTGSDNLRGEALQKFPPLVNTDGVELPANQKIDPGIVINLTTNPVTDKQANLSYLTPGTDWSNIRANEDHRRQTLMNSEGIPETSASTDGTAPKQIGAKTIDEIELQESREDDKASLYDFEMELLQVIRMVNNYHQDKKDYKISDKTLSNEVYFNVEFQEEEQSETVTDKKARREMEKQFNISSDIDFIMQDKEVDRTEAERIWKENKALNKTQVSLTESLFNNKGVLQ